jgi:hypothetical protein
LAERHLPKVDVASSNLVSRSIHPHRPMRRLTAALAVLALAAACTGPAALEPSAPASAASVPSSIAPSTAPASPAASPSVAVNAEPTWARLDAIGPEPREDHTWTVSADGTRAYLFGGRDGSTVFGDTWEYDLASDSWTEIAATGPEPRFGHEAVWADGHGLVVFAGQAGVTFFNDLWAFDPESRAWSRLPSTGDVPVARYGTCAGIGPDGRLWISHGFTADQVRFADTVAYDFASGEWRDETPDAPTPISRCLHGCWWTPSGELALFAGQTTGVAALDDLWLLVGGSWQRVVAVTPSARNLYARARVDGGTVVFGGQALDRTYLADLHVIPDDGGDAVAISPTGETPPARAGAEMVLDSARGRILMFGGRDAETAYADVWALEGVAEG